MMTAATEAAEATEKLESETLDAVLQQHLVEIDQEPHRQTADPQVREDLRLKHRIEAIHAFHLHQDLTIHNQIGTKRPHRFAAIQHG